MIKVEGQICIPSWCPSSSGLCRSSANVWELLRCSSNTLFRPTQKEIFTTLDFFESGCCLRRRIHHLVLFCFVPIPFETSFLELDPRIYTVTYFTTQTRLRLRSPRFQLRMPLKPQRMCSEASPMVTIPSLDRRMVGFLVKFRSMG